MQNENTFLKTSASAAHGATRTTTTMSSIS